MDMGQLWWGLKRRWRGRRQTQSRGTNAIAAPPVPANRDQMPRGRRTGYLHEQAFAAEMVRFRQDGDGPRLHVFSLSDFRVAAGAKWDRLQILVAMAFETIIRRHVDVDKDVFTRLDAEIACLALPNSSRSDSRKRVAGIARDLAAHLFGDSLVDGRRPQVLAANLSLDEALTAEGDMDRAAIEKALAQSAAALEAEAVKDKAPPAKAKAAIFAISGTQAEPLPEPDWLLPDSGAAQAQPATPSHATSWYDQPAQPLRGADAERQVLRIDRGLSGAGGAFSAESALTLVWTPTWVTGRNEVAACHARILRADKSRGPALEGVHAYDGLAPVEVLTLDRFAAIQAARELKTMACSRRRMGLTVPVHWMSLSPKSRDFIRMPFEDCAADARRRLLKIEIFGVNQSVPTIILSRMFAPLEGLGCDVMVRLPLASPDLIAALPAARAVGVDLAELADRERVGDAELFERLSAFREVARQHHKACYVWGVRRRPLIVQLVKAGFSLVNGPGIMCDLAHPALPSRAAQ